jgi:hypothetical protein
MNIYNINLNADFEIRNIKLKQVADVQAQVSIFDNYKEVIKARFAEARNS